MKVLVEEVKAGMSPFGGAIRLIGNGYVLGMGIPMITARKIAMIQEPHRRGDDRAIIEDFLEEQIKELCIEELHIDHISEEGTYSSVLRIDGKDRRVIPSEGVLLCIVAGKPIYFDDSLEGVVPLGR